MGSIDVIVDNTCGIRFSGSKLFKIVVVPAAAGDIFVRFAESNLTRPFHFLIIGCQEQVGSNYEIFFRIGAVYDRGCIVFRFDKRQTPLKIFPAAEACSYGKKTSSIRAGLKELIFQAVYKFRFFRPRRRRG